MHPFLAAYLLSLLIGGMMFGGSAVQRVASNTDEK